MYFNWDKPEGVPHWLVVNVSIVQALCAQYIVYGMNMESPILGSKSVCSAVDTESHNSWCNMVTSKQIREDRLRKRKGA